MQGIMARTSEQYWRERQEQRLANAESRGNDSILQTLSIYQVAEDNINREIKRLYDNFAKQTSLSTATLKQILSGQEKKQFALDVQSKMDSFGLKFDSVYPERYIMRLDRLEALKQQVYWEVAAIAPQEQEITGVGYRDILNESYRSFHADFREAGFGSPFSTLDTRISNQILSNGWLGQNYSQRVWGNVSELARTLPSILGGGLVSGQSYQKTAQMIKEQFDVKRYEATRLVRTESNFMYGQAERQSYIDDGISEYTLDPFLDGRTSKICRSLDPERIYKVSEIMVGKNYHPFHPNCRTTSLPVIESMGEPVARENSNVPEVYPQGQSRADVVQNIPQSGNIIATNTEFTGIFQKNAVQVSGNVRESVQYYTDDGYRRINSELRKGTVSKYIESQVENIDSAFSDKYLETDFFAYRGIDLKNLGTDLAPGKRIKDNGYMSFSFNLAEANQFSGEIGGDNAGIIEIIIPQKTKTLVPYVVSETRSMEQEVILPRGTELEIIEREDNYIRAKLVPKKDEE